MSRRDATAHKRYLELFGLLETRDDELSGAFDDMRRSRAIHRLIAMRRLGLLTDQEMEGFTQETRDALAAAMDL